MYNYGSCLQAYATQEVFKKHNVDVEIIDYITPIRTKKNLLFGARNTSIHYKIGKAASIILKEMTFGRFIKKNFHLSKRYITDKDLKNDPPKADIYVTGSDQTWNSTYNQGIDRGFFLDFVSDDAKRISFVSSFGKEKLDPAEVELTAHYLKRYSAISVREDTAKIIVESLGIKGPVQLIDPTLQIPGDEWVRIASKRLIKEPYLVLMLLYQEDNHATEYARKIANEKGLKLVKISWELRKPKYIDKLLTHRSPADFLSLFYNANFVVTNSFHGLAFSINFGKQFIVIPRNEYNSRIDSLLRLFGLNERLVSSEEAAMIQANTIIDYSSIEHTLSYERKRASEFIDMALN